jgi:DNA polymerase III delta prime subunit
MSDLWLNKYSPKKSSDIVSNGESIKHIDSWIKNFYVNNESCIIISGPHGIGKTLSIKLLFDENEYEPLILYPYDIKNHKFMEEIIKMKEPNNNIFKFFKSEQKKYALIFDEAETITLHSEKTYLTELFKDNNKKKNYPIVFICNTQHSKLIDEIKKMCSEVKFFHPKFKEVKDFVQKIIKQENIQFESNDIYELIIEFSQYDIRRLIIILQELQHTYGNGLITLDQIKNFIDSSRQKDINVGLFEASDLVFQKTLNLQSILQLYETEKVLLPLMVHENYYGQIYVTENSMEEIISKTKKISDSISIGDNIETSIYTDQNWFFQNIHGFFTCVNTSRYINKKKVDRPKVEFSSDLNKTSLKNINKKNINNLLCFIPNKTINEILIINSIINSLLRVKRFKTIIKILKFYKNQLTIKDIELCTKIDKTTQKYVLENEDKKMLQKILKYYEALEKAQNPSKSLVKR